MILLTLSACSISLVLISWAVLSIGSDVRKIREAVDILSVILSEKNK